MSATQHRSGEMEHAIEEVVDRRIKHGAKRVGYVLAAVINGVMLWIAHQLLDWKWPEFLTPKFDEMLSIITVSFVASILANLLYAQNDGWPIKPLGELVTSALGFVTALRFWHVFPFEFSGDDLSWILRLVLIVAMVGSAVGAIVQLVKLAAGELEPRESAKPRS